MSATHGQMMRQLGAFIQAERLRQNKTQDEVAKFAGISRKTLVQLEGGSGGSIGKLLWVLYALNRQDVWEVFATTDIVNPLVVAKRMKPPRQRASKREKQ